MRCKYYLSLILILACFITTNAARTGEVTTDNSITGGATDEEINPIELASGNIVVVSKDWDGGRGAVTCLTPLQYQSGDMVISESNSLVGASTDDKVGSGDVVALGNGHYVVVSPLFDHNGITNVGAVTWVNGETCIPYNENSVAAVVSSSNSLVGAAADDAIGWGGVTVLTNGNYVVASPNFDNGVVDVGAVTWHSGTGSSGVVSAANSLVGMTASDQIGSGGVVALANGHYVVVSPNFDNGATNTGAVTWRDGSGISSGVVSIGNSLVGTTANDQVGSRGVFALPNSHYVMASPNWDNAGTANVGAVTWADGTTVTGGAVSSANSLIGTASSDQVGSGGVVALPNSRYIVSSPNWDNSNILLNYGAVTWMDGTTASNGTVTTTNSLTGASSGDMVGSGGIIALTGTNNYIVLSPNWDHNTNFTPNLGAVTRMDGTTSTSGKVTASNSLIGSTSYDAVGSGGAISLSNGNYVFISPLFDNNGTLNVGAVTWGDGTTITSSTVNASNSLIGSTTSDFTEGHVTALTGGDYVVAAPFWDDGLIPDVGAVKWMSGVANSTGTFSSANSLVGTTEYNHIGRTTVVALTNGSYAVVSSEWDNGSTSVANVGAVTWATSTTTGAVSSSNSLIGTLDGDSVGRGGVFALSDGGYLVSSPFWNNYSSAFTYSAGIDKGFVVSSSSGGMVTEGGASESYVIALASQPTATVTVTVVFGADVVVNGENDGSTDLIFDASNWDEAQNVIVTAFDDVIDEDDENMTLIHMVSSGDTSYGSAPIADVSFVIVDDDTAGVTITESDNETGITEGDTDTYTVVLNSQPTADVSIATTAGTGILVAPPAIFTFNAGNWNQPQTGTIQAVDDVVDQDERDVNVLHVINTAGDAKYDALADVTLVTTVLDNDTAGVTVSKTAATVTENGAGDSYTVKLDSQPTADVSITLNFAAGDFSADMTTLDFTTVTWNQEQAVTLTAVDDSEVEAPENVTITHSATSTDAKYNAIMVAGVTVTVNSDDMATATSTPDPSTPTFTPEVPTATATPEPVMTELLLNSGFEDHIVKPSQPDNWTPKNSTRDRLKCNTETHSFARNGLCAYRFVGSTGEKSRLAQSVLNPAGLSEGMTLNASVYYKTNGVTPKLKMKLVVFYLNAPLSHVTKSTINITSSDAYIIHILTPYPVESGTVEKVKLQFQNKATSGKIYLDDASVNY